MTYKKHLPATIFATLLVTLVPQVAQAASTQRSSVHAVLHPHTATVTICVGLGVPAVQPPSGYVVTKVSSAASSLNPGRCGPNNTWGINSQVWTAFRSGMTVCVGLGSPVVPPPSGYVVTKVNTGVFYNNPGPCGAYNNLGINSQVWTKLTSGTTVCVGQGSPSVSPLSGFVVTKVSSSGPYYNLGSCGINNNLGVNAQVWTTLKSGTTVCVGQGSPSVSPPSGYFVSSQIAANPGPNPGSCGDNNSSGINAQVWTAVGDQRGDSVTICVGKGSPNVSPPLGYVVTKVSSAGPYYNPGRCGLNNDWGINAQVWSPLKSGTTVCVGAGTPSVVPPRGYVVTRVSSSGPYYSLGPCGANNGWGINSQVWSLLTSGTTVCVGAGTPSVVPPLGYVVTRVSPSGPYYSLGPCGANNGWGINSQVWTTLKSGMTVCVGSGSPLVSPPPGYVVTKAGSAGPPYSLGPCGANNASGINSQVWTLLYGTL